MTDDREQRTENAGPMRLSWKLKAKGSRLKEKLATPVKYTLVGIKYATL